MYKTGFQSNKLNRHAAINKHFVWCEKKKKSTKKQQQPRESNESMATLIPLLFGLHVMDINYTNLKRTNERKKSVTRKTQQIKLTVCINR